MVTRASLLVLACGAIAIAVFAVRPIQTPGPLARDFEAYWAAGSAWSAHADPYSRAIWNAERRAPGVDARRYELLPFLGPPATLPIWSVASRLPYQNATRVWWGLLGISTLALVATVLRGAGAPVTTFSFFAALVLAASFAPISSDLALGQIALPAFLGAVMLVVAANRSVVLATLGGWLAFAQPNAAIGLTSQLGRNRATLAIVLGGLLAYVLGAFAVGWTWPIAYARVIVAHSAAERFVAIQFSPAAIAYDFGALPSQAEAIGAAIAVLAVAAAIIIVRRVSDAFARFAAFSALAPFVTGFFHEHDLLVAYAAAIWCASRTTAVTRTIALAGTLLVGFDWLGLAQRPSGIPQSLLLAIAVFAAFVALGERTGLRSSVWAGLPVVALFAAAAILATHYPVPIWPNALANFQDPPNAGVAEIWRAEQGASGLLAAVPAWALLRSLSLLGCALLAYAIYRHSSYCRTV